MKRREQSKEAEFQGYLQYWAKGFFDNVVGYNLFTLIEKSKWQMKTISLDKITFTNKSSNHENDRNPLHRRVVTYCKIALKTF